ncbi:MAG: FAD-binding oxidoreductase [Acidobacteria bacterium]|nr:FAD-binding oxidoreductase [Acidobacteriota bacterium]
MRRWNGWGEESVSYPLPSSAAQFLETALGPGSPPRDATFASVVGTVPRSRLPQHDVRVLSDAAPRLLHARGQSLPDWIALRTGRVGSLPDGVANPETPADVRGLIRFAHDAGAHIIPYGGGTSVVGHISPQPGDAPVLTIDMGRLSRLQELDQKSHLAVFGAGVYGPDLEAQLRALGFTLGHFPQSFEFSTLGGWIATRSSGQQSMGYGRIERLFAGGKLESPTGPLDLPAFPASAAGPDLREIVLGSEGRLGVITEATVRVRPLPEREDFHALFLPDWESAQAAAREIAQSAVPLSMLRISTPVETRTSLLLAGRPRLIGALERLLAARGAGEAKCMLLLGLTGRESIVSAARREVLAMSRHHGGIHVGRAFGRHWQKNRFRAPYLRNSLWEAGYAVDTLETATSWANVPVIVSSIEAGLAEAIAQCNEKAHIFTHLSHSYPHGSSVYTTYIFRLAPDPDETLERWRRLKSAASAAIVACGGTISHQHGVGIDHAPYLHHEKGVLGMQALARICSCFDPDGLMNPGKLVGPSA